MIFRVSVGISGKLLSMLSNLLMVYKHILQHVLYSWSIRVKSKFNTSNAWHDSRDLRMINKVQNTKPCTNACDNRPVSIWSYVQQDWDANHRWNIEENPLFVAVPASTLAVDLRCAQIYLFFRFQKMLFDDNTGSLHSTKRHTYKHKLSSYCSTRIYLQSFLRSRSDCQISVTV